MSKQYHKLVRDQIPEIIEKTGKTCCAEILDDETYLRLLDEKLGEELAEYQESKSLEELADLLEVMEAVVAARGFAWEQLLSVKAEKRPPAAASIRKSSYWKYRNETFPKAVSFRAKSRNLRTEHLPCRIDDAKILRRAPLAQDDKN